MKKPIYIVILSFALLFSCTTNRNSNDFEQETAGTDSIQHIPAIISGNILNLQVYPHIKEVTLTIPGFKGDETVVTTKINESGQFAFEFYPKTKREVQLYPIEDILVIQPGDSLHIIKDFKDIGNSSFYGDKADLNHQISKFRGRYLGRYPTNYKQPYFDFKNSCEEEKTRNYQRLIEFQEKNPCTDEFNNWAIKLIELDYCTALFHYPFQHLLRSKNELKDSSAYFSFVENLEDKIDNSIVMSGYFKTSEQYVSYQLTILKRKYHQQIEKKDTVVDLMIDDLFSSTRNNYLAQFSLRTFLNISLNTNKTDWIDNYSELINTKINDSFLRNNLQEHYDRINEFNNNPKRFSDAILSSENIELNNRMTVQPGNEKNTVKELIEANPGKVIYVDFWAPWCPPCLHNMQYSKQLIADFKNKDVEVAFICINSKKDLWREKVNELNIGGQHIFCDEETTRSIRQRFGFSGIPYYLLINKEGVIVDFGNHLTPQNENVKKQIEKLLNE